MEPCEHYYSTAAIVYLSKTQKNVQKYIRRWGCAGKSPYIVNLHPTDAAVHDLRGPVHRTNRSRKLVRPSPPRRSHSHTRRPADLFLVLCSGSPIRSSLTVGPDLGLGGLLVLLLVTQYVFYRPIETLCAVGGGGREQFMPVAVRLTGRKVRRTTEYVLDIAGSDVPAE